MDSDLLCRYSMLRGDETKLTQIVPPPDAPQEAQGDWFGVERDFYTLPFDYKELVRIYGTGCFDNFVWLLNPFSEHKNLNLIEQAKLAHKVYQSLRDEFQEPQNFSFFPERDGLLPFAITDNGDYLNWRTKGIPDQWSVVVSAGREPEYESFECSASKFLEDIFARSLRCRIFPVDFPSINPSFKRYS